VIGSTFVREGDGWKLAFHQQSPADRPDPGPKPSQRDPARA
jgi:hypothetical protein